MDNAKIPSRLFRIIRYLHDRSGVPLECGYLFSSFMPFLNPRMARPKLLPNLGRGLAPKIKKMTKSFCGPAPKIGIASYCKGGGLKKRRIKKKRGC
jgi:hypothetical protein